MPHEETPIDKGTARLLQSCLMIEKHFEAKNVAALRERLLALTDEKDGIERLFIALTCLRLDMVYLSDAIIAKYIPDPDNN